MEKQVRFFAAGSCRFAAPHLYLNDESTHLEAIKWSFFAEIASLIHRVCSEWHLAVTMQNWLGI